MSGPPTSSGRRPRPVGCAASRGSDPRLEARLLEALSREADPRPPRGLLLDRALELTEGIAAALGGEVAGDVRRRRDVCERLAVVCAADDPARCARAVRRAAPDRGDRGAGRTRRALGVTVEGVPVQLVVAAPERLGTELIRATGTPAYVAALEPLPDGPRRGDGLRGAGRALAARPSCASSRSAASRPRCSSRAAIRGDLHCHSTWSDGRASIEEMGRAAQARGYEYLAICDHTPAVGAVQGLTADDVRRQGEEIAAANEMLAPFRILRGIECDILADGRLDLPDDVLAELDWVQASVHARAADAAPRDDRARLPRPAQPVRELPQPSHRTSDHAPARERRRSRPRLRGRGRPRRGAGGQRAGAAPGSERRARPRRAAGRRPDRVLHRRPLGPGAGQHGAVGGDRSARMGDRRRCAQHALPGRTCWRAGARPRAA